MKGLFVALTVKSDELLRQGGEISSMTRRLQNWLIFRHFQNVIGGSTG